METFIEDTPLSLSLFPSLNNHFIMQSNKCINNKTEEHVHVTGENVFFDISLRHVSLMSIKI